MGILIAAVCILALLYVLSLMGRRGRPELQELKNWYYAHRGLHREGVPENSMAAFRAALDGGYGIELDVHLLKDGSLAVIHDSDLKRVTGQEGYVEDLTAEELSGYHLLGTEETIPELWQVLELYAGKAPLIIELKSWKGNYAALSQRVCQELEGYEGLYCIESFDPWCVAWLRKNRPEIIRGQLSENFLQSGGSLPWLMRFAGTYCLENFLTRPDFLAYKYRDRKNLSVALCRNLWGIQGVSWTIRTQEEFDRAVQEGWIPIFEGFLPEKNGNDDLIE